MKFQIFCDSAADLPVETAEKNHIGVVPFYVSMDGEHYLQEGVDLAIPDFYRTMAEHADCYPKTSMPSIQDYVDAFLPYVQKEIPILCICLTRQFSGSLEAAREARTELLEEYPKAKIELLDSQLVTALEGLFVLEAARLRDAGLTLSEALPKLEAIRSSGQIFFTTKDLKYLQHGGRLGKAACTAGSLLNIKPILHFHGGALAPAELCRGRKKSLEKVVDKFIAYLKEQHMDLRGYWFGTGIGLDIPEYGDFQETLRQKFQENGICPDQWVRVRIGATIGVHTGPYPMGLGILKKCTL